MNARCNCRIALPLLFAALLLPAALPAEEKSAAQQAWEAQIGEAQRQNPAFAFVEDDPALPRVLLIGDSISIGYTPHVREVLQGVANVHRIPANGGDTNRGLANIDAWLGEGKWDLIHFNWGLHDLKRVKDGQLDASMERSLTPEAYRENLQKLTARLQATGARLIWADTTPVPEGSQGRIPGDELLYNTIAAEVMAALGVQRNDLHAAITPYLATHQRPANVHFLDEGSKRLGETVAKSIAEALRPEGADAVAGE